MRLLKRTAAFVLFLLLPFLAAQQKPITVYITKTGTKYHLEKCSSLRKSKIPITLEEAKKRGYLRCKGCRPPQVTGGVCRPIREE